MVVLLVRFSKGPDARLKHMDQATAGGLLGSGCWVCRSQALCTATQGPSGFELEPPKSLKGLLFGYLGARGSLVPERL